jgi:hypothetical protein
MYGGTCLPISYCWGGIGTPGTWLPNCAGGIGTPGTWFTSAGGIGTPGTWLVNCGGIGTPGTCELVAAATPAYPPSNIKATREERSSAFIGEQSPVFLTLVLLVVAFQCGTESRNEYTVRPCFFNGLLVQFEY